jgi:hypothetical protein
MQAAIENRTAGSNNEILIISTMKIMAYEKQRRERLRQITAGALAAGGDADSGV